MADTNNESIYGILKDVLAHSSDQVFAVFSGILVISSLQSKSCTLILVSFLTLIYALIAHKLTALRKHEELGDYAVGKDNIQIILFTAIYHLYFVWWSTGVMAILLNNCLLLIINLSILFFNIVLTIWWFCNLFFGKIYEENKWKKGGHCYGTRLFCKNCNYNHDLKGKVKIPKGVKFENHRCLRCKVKDLARKKEIIDDLSIRFEIFKK